MKTLRTTALAFLLATGFACSGGAAGASGEAGEGVEPEGPPLDAGKADEWARTLPATSPLPAICDLDRPLQVFFAPDDPTVTVEYAMIDRVRQARRAATGAWEEGANPYRIRYAVYNLTHKGIAQRLADAEADGVDVQVLTEADRMVEPWNETDDLFRSRGLEVAADHHALDDAGRRTADLVGIADDGLMHLKTRIFETPGWSAVVSGSMNPNESAGVNEETFHVIRDPAVIARYVEAYEAVLAGRPLANRWDDAAAVNVLFTPAGSGDRAAARLLQWIEEEDEQVLLMVFSLRNVSAPGAKANLVETLRRKVAAGVPVYAITDRKQSDGIDLDGSKAFDDDRTDDWLRQAGVHVYEAMNDATAFYSEPYAFAAMHHKVAVLGRTHVRVVTDAANWTGAALGSWKYPEKNVESMLFIDSARLDDGYTGRRYLAQWQRVLSRYAAQSAATDREPAFADVAARLQELPGWPSQKVGFVASPAYTSSGETIHASGGPDVLGRWGELGPGVPLGTTADDYPAWSSATPVPMALGARFEWKLVARAAEAARWEGGANRVSFALPPACAGRMDGGVLETTEAGGAWRE